MITVFTPTYNRAYTLERLYESLKRQTYKGFEWIVVDDGSVDDTESLFKRISEEDFAFSVKYRKVENGGKHRAINKGVQIAEGSLFFIVDSDDFLPENALEKIVKVANSIEKEQITDFAGVCGQKRSLKEEIGTSFEGQILDATYLEAKKYNISGDKAEVYYTDILRKYPFPEYDDEKFIPESVVWDRIAADGLKLRYFNEIVYFCEYLPDGLTAMGDKKIVENPIGYGMYLQQAIKYGKINRLVKWNSIMRYYDLLRKEIGVSKVAKNIDIVTWKLVIRMLGLKIFYRIYR